MNMKANTKQARDIASNFEDYFGVSARTMIFVGIALTAWVVFAQAVL